MKPLINLESILETIPVHEAVLKADLLYQFRDMLLEANQRMNLISRRDETRIIERHFLDSIGLLTKIQFPLNARILDLGSGAGFPGLPLKIVRPDLELLLVEAVQKKASFLKRSVHSLKLLKTEVVCARMENVAPDIPPVDFIVSRAVASLDKVVKWGQACVRPGGQFILIKGTDIDNELRIFEKKADTLGAKTLRYESYCPFHETGVTRKSTLIFVEMGRR